MIAEVVVADDSESKKLTSFRSNCTTIVERSCAEPKSVSLLCVLDIAWRNWVTPSRARSTGNTVMSCTKKLLQSKIYYYKGETWKKSYTYRCKLSELDDVTLTCTPSAGVSSSSRGECFECFDRSKSVISSFCISKICMSIFFCACELTS